MSSRKLAAVNLSRRQITLAGYSAAALQLLQRDLVHAWRCIWMGRVDRRSGPEALFSMDQWPGQEFARTRLLRFLSERRIPNPIVLTVDIHSNWVHNLQVDCDLADDAVVATSAGP